MARSSIERTDLQENERHVLTIEDPAVIHNVLDALSAGIAPLNGGGAEVRRSLKEFSKQGFAALILNLRVVDEPPDGEAVVIKHIGASLVGEVLVVACVATRPWVSSIEGLRQERPRPKPLFSGLGAFVRTFF